MLYLVTQVNFQEIEAEKYPFKKAENEMKDSCEEEEPSSSSQSVRAPYVFALFVIALVKWAFE